MSMKSDLDRHIERHQKDKEFKLYFGMVDTERKIAQQISLRKKRESAAERAEQKHGS